MTADVAPDPPPAQWRNWARTVEGTPVRRAVPGSEEEIRQLVAGTAAAGGRIAVAGAGHSFAPLVDSEGATLLSLAGHTGIVGVDGTAGTVTVRAGTTLRDLNAGLTELGWALPNQTAIDAQTIGGTIATASHGGSCRYGSLSEHVTAARIVTATGEVTVVTEQDEAIDAVRAHLGALGVVTELTLRIVPAFSVRKVVVRRSLSQMLTDLEWLQGKDFGGFYWFPHTSTVQLWWAERTGLPASQADPPAGWRAPKPLLRTSMAPVPVARWVNRLLSTAGGNGSVRNVRADLAMVHPLAPRQQVLEYGVPAELAADAVEDFARLVSDRRLRVAAPVEIRFTGADTAWLSPAHGRRSCYVNVACYLSRRTDWATPIREIATLFAQRYEGRSHWAKVHWHTREELVRQYPRWEDFQRVRREMDPEGVFTSGYLRKFFGPAPESTQLSQPMFETTRGDR